MPASRRFGAAFAAAGLLAAAGLHIAAALRTPLGAASDDALHLLLARNILSGGYAVPDAAGIPATDPLPGFPALMALPVRLLAPHWLWLRGAELLAVAALLVLAFRLSRRLSGEAAGWAAAFLVAVNPTLVGWAGVALPDAPFCAVSVAGFLLLCSPAFSAAGLAALGAAGALLRPEGVALVPALALGCYFRAGARRAAGVLAASFLPLGLWILRDRLVANETTAYVDHWRTLSGFASEGTLAPFAQMLVHGLGGPVGFAFGAALGLAALAAAAFGARALARAKSRGARSAFAALAAFLLGITLMHLGWKSWQSRYVLPFVVALVPFFSAAFAAAYRRSGPAAVFALAFVAAPGLRTAVGYARDGVAAPRASFWPHLENWIETQTPADAVLVTAEPHLTTLLTGRRAYFPSAAASRDAWIADLRARGVDYVVVGRSGPRAYFSGDAARLLSDFDSWAVAGPPLALVFGDADEGRLVLRVDHAR